MIRGKTTSGFEFEIDENNLNDWEFLETFQDFQEGNFFAVVKIVKMLLGDEGHDRLKAHVKKTTGALKLEDMQKEIEEIMMSNEQTKNS